MPPWFKNTIIHCSTLFLFAGIVKGQNYYLRGDASVLNSSLGCYHLSPSKNWVSGAAWNKTKISLKNSFKKEFMLYFDNDDGGADGIGFVMHRDTRGFATNPVSGYIGYQNITPSVTVEFDIYYNSNLQHDTKISAGGKDHIDIVKNGDVYAWPTLLSGGAVTALPNGANIEDGKCHNVVIEWDASKKILTVFFDGYKRVSQSIDMVKDVFSNKDSVIWGFTGGTGSQKTNHYMCEGNLKFTASDTCINSGDTIQLGTSNNTAVQWKPQVRISCDNCPSPKVWPNFKTNYTAELTNGICTIRDTVEVYVTTKNFGSKKIFLPNDTNVCSFPISVKTIKGFPGYPEMYWEDNSQSIPRNITKPGTYWLQVSDGLLCPKIRDTIQIYKDDTPVLSVSGDTLLCAGDSGIITVSEKYNFPLTWTDGYSGSQRKVYPGSKFTVVSNSKCGADTLIISIPKTTYPVVSMPADTTFCTGSANLGTKRQIDAFYKWENGDTNLIRNVTSSGNYKLIAWNACGADTADIKVRLIALPKIALTADSALCGKDSGLAIATAKDADITWSTGSTDTFITIAKNNWYSVSAYNVCGGASLSFYVKRYELPYVNLSTDTILCTKPALISVVPQSGHTYVWDNGITGISRTVNLDGKYFAVGSGRCGSDTGFVNVTFLNAPQISAVYDSFVCGVQKGTATAQSTDPGWKWSTGETGNAIQISGGTYWLAVKNYCGTDTFHFNVNQYNLPAIVLPKDTIACSNPVLIGTPAENNIAYSWSDGNTLNPRPVSIAGNYRLTAKGKCADSAEIIVLFDSLPKVKLGNDTFLCPGSEYDVKDLIKQGSSVYRWDDGSTAMPRTFYNPGTYELSKSNICGSAKDILLIADSCNYCKIWLPNAFIPVNGLNGNQQYKPVFSCVPEEYLLRIYNRWGEKLFESSDYKTSWDGIYLDKVVPAGVYVAVMQALVQEGSSTRRREIRTSVTVLD